jgi:drug/metabolite transporter (DMT)-like permease
MTYLLTASLLWSLSFGLISRYLGGIDPNAVAFIRLAISFIIFLPFLRLKQIDQFFTLKLILLGAIQYGLMYLTYIRSYKYLEGYQVAVFTIFTPIFVTLIYDTMRWKFHAHHLLTALLAVIGTAFIVWPQRHIGGTLRGIILIQTANLCFASGQVSYKIICSKLSLQKNKTPSVLDDTHTFGWMYFGAALVTGLFSAATTDWSEFSLSHTQTGILIYLGIIPSGIAFFLWNIGAKRVNSGILAAFNNIKIPLAVFVSILLFKEKANSLHLLIGGAAIIISILLSKHKQNNIRN